MHPNKSFSFEKLKMEDYPPVLYRYSKQKYLESFVNEGIVSFGQAKYYESKDGLTYGQRDDEQGRHYIPDLLKTRFVINGMPITHLKDVTIRQGLRNSSSKPLNYYLLCCSLVYDKNLYKEFEADACIEISDVETFFTLIRNKLNQGDIPLDFGLGQVSYYDTSSLPSTNEQIDLIFMKSKEYSHQAEYRFVIIDDKTQLTVDRLGLSLGSLKAICKLR